MEMLLIGAIAFLVLAGVAVFLVRRTAELKKAIDDAIEAAEKNQD